MLTQMKKRKYTLRRRAAKQDATRARIVEAAMALHEELGPGATTVSAVAGRAGVQRLTVYRHFPDDASLFEACTSHWLSLHPPPVPAQWEGIADPDARCRAALGAFYAYYRRTGGMWRSAYRDLAQVPALAGPMVRVEDHLAGVRDDLVAAWKPAPADRQALEATTALALRFTTWDELQGLGLDTDAMAALAARWIACVGGG